MLRSRHLRFSNSRKIDSKFPRIQQPSFRNIHQEEKSKVSSPCKCELCLNKLSIRKAVSENNLMLNSQIISTFNKSDLQYVLSSITGRKNKKGLNINIPQTCFYQNNKPQIMYIYDHQQVKQISAKRFKSRQLLKQFVRMRQDIKFNTSKLINSSIKQLNTIHQKLFERLKPSCKQFITNTSQLRYKSYKVHNKNKFEIKQNQTKNQQESCILYFQNGSSVLLNQDQFKQFKIDDTYGKNLQYIQALVPSKETLVSQYDQYSCINHKALYNTARSQVDLLLQQSQGFDGKQLGVNQRQELYIFLKKYPSTYAQYQTFKIVHYIAKVTGTVIFSMKLSWTFTQQNDIFLLNVMKMSYKKRNIKQTKNALTQKFQTLKLNRDSQLYHIQSLKQMMLNHWKYAKQQKRIQDDPVFIKPSQDYDNSFYLKNTFDLRNVKVYPRLHFRKSKNKLNNHFQLN